MIVDLLLDKDKEEYASFLLKFEKTLLYQSWKYKNLVSDFLNCEPTYYVARNEQGEIVGILPLFVKDMAHGKVINSLPFYGSNGAVIVADDNLEAKDLLLNKYKELLSDEDVLTGTIITSPFEDNNDFYEQQLDHQCKDTRIGQITSLPDHADGVMPILHSKTRNTVRKGLKSGVEVSWENGLDYIPFLFETHKENMTRINGKYKPEHFFELVKKHFDYGTDYRIYVAFLEGQPIGALLNMYYNNTVEYFTPVTVTEYREYQPMSVAIYEAMCDAANEGFKYWNWGGTWLSQGGVYDFKKRWGTEDYNYYYYTTIRNEKVRDMSQEVLLGEFPYFFVIPFSELNSSTD